MTRLGVSIVGGCCGKTRAHRGGRQRVGGARRCRGRSGACPRSERDDGHGLAQDPPPTLIGDGSTARAQGRSAAPPRRDYESILQVAREQIEGGAHLLDVCVALTERPDEAEQMGALVKLLSQGVSAPLAIDSTEAEVVRAALERCPGRALINSINLENGRKRIDDVVPLAVVHGAVLVALTIDEQGMAKTAERKLEVARRIHAICVGEYVWTPPICVRRAYFTLATGDVEFRRPPSIRSRDWRASSRSCPRPY